MRFRMALEGNAAPFWTPEGDVIMAAVSMLLSFAANLLQRFVVFLGYLGIVEVGRFPLRQVRT